MNKLEQKFTTQFQKWVKYNWIGEPFLFEVKVVKEKNIMNFKTYLLGKREYQLYTLLNVSKGEYFIFKFSDYGQLGTPCDGIVLKGKGYYVIKWSNEDIFYLIDSLSIKRLIDNGIKLITKEDADNICYQKYML